MNKASVSPIMENLWIGSVPPPGDYSMMDLIVLAAEEIPAEEAGIQGDVQVLEAPLPDGKLNDKEQKIALEAAATVAGFLSAGKRVLSTCAMGINRSSFIVALALVLMGGKPREVIGLIRAQRDPKALSNPYFIENIYQAYIDILDKEIEGLVEAINQMLESRSSAAYTHTD